MGQYSFVKDLQVSWLKLLVTKDMSVIEKMNSSKLVKLNPAALQFVRSFEIMRDLSAMDHITNDISLPSKTGAEELMKRMVSLLGSDLSAPDAESLGLQSVPKMRTLIRAFFSEKAKEMCQKAKEVKKVSAEIYAKFHDLVFAVENWNEDRVFFANVWVEIFNLIVLVQ